MKSNQIHQTIAQQIDHMKPDHLRPGIDVGMEPLDATTLRVLVRVDHDAFARFDIRYDEGRDTYVFTAGDDEPISDIYCDQLGELVFGENAKPWTQPLVQISDDDGETWTVIA